MYITIRRLKSGFEFLELRSVVALEAVHLPKLFRDFCQPSEINSNFMFFFSVFLSVTVFCFAGLKFLF